MPDGAVRRLGGASVLTLLVALVVSFTGIGMAWAALAVNFYDVVETDDWTVPAPGPSGITHFTPANTMLVVDTDANNYWGDGDTGIDVWEMNLDGIVVNAWSTGFEHGEAEPTGVNYAVELNRLFITNDDGNYYIFDPGPDGNFGTGDEPDPNGPIEVEGSGDLEDPVYDPDSNDLFVLDGGGGTIYRLNPATGAEIDTIELGPLGPTNWEGLAMTPNGELLVGANVGQQIFVIDTNGVELQPPINVDDISGDGSNLALLSGMGISTPGVGGSAYDIWIADRQMTSNTNNEAHVDGRVWRLSTNGTPPTTTTTTTTMPTTTTTTTTSTTTLPPTTTTTTTTVPNNPPPDPGPDPEPVSDFTDTSGHIFENAIAWLAGEGITQGCNPPLNTKFCPDDRVTRGQMATFLVRALDYSDNGGGDLFDDDNGHIFETAIDRLATAGVTVGCNPPTNTRFCPDDFVTRGQMAAFLGRAFEYTDSGAGNYFTDDNDSVFETAIDRLRTAGVTLGCNPPTNTRYCPDDLVTRGQMATFLKRAFGE